jgi:Zn-dependent peptidase ImmA (M78 family)/DNA-binding XRE family transcriptional regulator
MRVETWADVGRRIVEAREAVGLSQTELSLRAGIERTALSKAEKGTRGTSALELARVARTLDLPLEWFVTDSPVSVVSRRAAAEGTSARLDQELDLAARDVELLRELGFLRGAGGRVPSTLKSHNQAELLALEFRSRYDLPPGPIHDLASVVERADLMTFSVAAGAASDDGAYAAVDALGVAVINASMKPGRRRFTLAHELGHHLLADAFAVDLDLLGGPGGRESYINSFAVHLLLPRSAVTERWHQLGGTQDLRTAAIHLAVEFRVSWTALLGHLATLKLAPRPELRRQMKRVPRKAELLRLGLVVAEELAPGFTTPRFQVAAMSAYSSDAIGRSRLIELLRGAISDEDLDDGLDGDGE